MVYTALRLGRTPTELLAGTSMRDLQELYVFDNLEKFEHDIKQKRLTDEDKAKLLMAALMGGKGG